MGHSYADTGLVRAQARFVRSSARKVRVVLEHIRGKSAAEARVVLTMSTRDVARDIKKVLDSAVANATNNHGLDENTLVIHEAFADEGMTWKKWQPRARGRAMRIRKRTAHITILLRAVEPVAAPAPVQEEEAKPTRRRAARKKDTAVAETVAAETVVDETPVAEAVVEETPAAEAVVEDAPAVEEAPAEAAAPAEEPSAEGSEPEGEEA
jgi:large subunit ribosomal protein L22